MIPRLYNRRYELIWYVAHFVWPCQLLFQWTLSLSASTSMVSYFSKLAYRRPLSRACIPYKYPAKNNIYLCVCIKTQLKKGILYILCICFSSLVNIYLVCKHLLNELTSVASRQNILGGNNIYIYILIYLPRKCGWHALIWFSRVAKGPPLKSN